MIHSEQSIQKILYAWVKKKKKGIYPLSSVYVYKYPKFKWESDFFYATKHMMSVEIEIKITRKDFRRDKQKVKKHDIMRQIMDTDTSDQDIFVPNLFFYCAPEGVIPKDEVPDYAGLLEITKDQEVTLVKAAETITPNPATKMKERLLDIFYKKGVADEMKYINFMHEIQLASTDEHIKKAIYKYQKSKRV